MVAHCLRTGFSTHAARGTLWLSGDPRGFVSGDCPTQKDHKGQQQKGQKPPSEDRLGDRGDVHLLSSLSARRAEREKEGDMGMRLNCPSVWPPGSTRPPDIIITRSPRSRSPYLEGSAGETPFRAAASIVIHEG